MKSIYICAYQDDCYSDESLNTIQEGRDLFETQAYRPLSMRSGSSQYDVLTLYVPHVCHGLMSFFDASKVPLIINLHIPTDRPDRRRSPPDLAAVCPLR